MSENLYVSFRRDEAGRACFFNTFGTSVEDFMGRVNGFYGDWGSSRAGVIAWSPIHSSTHTVEEDCAAALAAGRVIEYVNGKYFARGIEDPELVALQTRPQHVEASCEEEKPAKSFTEQIKELAQLQLSSCDCVNDPYFRGLYNGLELALSVLESREPVYVNKPEQIERSTPKAPAFAALRLDAPDQFRAPRSI